MKLTNLELINAVQDIQAFSEKELPYETTLKISKNINILEKLLKEYNEEYRKLANEYLIKDEEGNFVESKEKPGLFLIKEGKAKEYSEKISILNSFENEIDLYKINSKELSGIKISAKTLLAINFMINEEEEEDK